MPKLRSCTILHATIIGFNTQIVVASTLERACTCCSCDVAVYFSMGLEGSTLSGVTVSKPIRVRIFSFARIPPVFFATRVSAHVPPFAFSRHHTLPEQTRCGALLSLSHSLPFFLRHSHPPPQRVRRRCYPNTVIPLNFLPPPPPNPRTTDGRVKDTHLPLSMSPLF